MVLGVIHEDDFSRCLVALEVYLCFSDVTYAERFTVGRPQVQVRFLLSYRVFLELPEKITVT